MIIQLMGSSPGQATPDMVVEGLNLWLIADHSTYRASTLDNQGKLKYKDRYTRVISTLCAEDIDEHTYSPLPVPLQTRLATAFTGPEAFSALIANNIVSKNCPIRVYWTQSRLWLTYGCDLIKHTSLTQVCAVNIERLENKVTHFNCYTFVKHLARSKPSIALSVTRVIDQITNRSATKASQ